MFDVIVIGSGPSGHTACIYLSRANLNVLMLEGDSSGPVIAGGLLTTTKIVENFPGFPDGIDGNKLTENFKKQSLKFGTQIFSETVEKIIIDKKDKYDLFHIYTNDNKYITKAVIISTGSTPRKLHVPGYDTFWQNGISTCAVCDGALYKNKIVAVVGGGDSACEEALHMSNLTNKVYLIHRRDTLRASKIMQDRVLKHKNIIMIWNTEIEKIDGNDSVNKLILKNNKTGDVSDLHIDGLFVAIGHDPNSDFVKNLVKCDNDKYIIVNKKGETSVKGIYASGDVCDKDYKQAITAAAFGCIAGLECEKYLATLKND